MSMDRFKRAVRTIQHAIRNRNRMTVMTSNLAIAVEEARMDHKLQILKEKVASDRSSCKSRDGVNLLLDVES